jgi:hypothetical protein
VPRAPTKRYQRKNSPFGVSQSWLVAWGMQTPLPLQSADTKRASYYVIWTISLRLCFTAITLSSVHGSSRRPGYVRERHGLIMKCVSVSCYSDEHNPVESTLIPMALVYLRESEWVVIGPRRLQHLSADVKRKDFSRSCNSPYPLRRLDQV